MRGQVLLLKILIQKINNEQKRHKFTTFFIHLFPFCNKLFIPLLFVADVITSTNFERHRRPLYKQRHYPSTAICKSDLVPYTS